jgi:hypothetical protein
MSPGGDSRVGLDELTQSQAFLSLFGINFLRDWIAIVMYLLPEDALNKGGPMGYNCDVWESRYPRMTEYFNPPLMAAVSSSDLPTPAPQGPDRPSHPKGSRDS